MAFYKGATEKDGFRFLICYKKKFFLNACLIEDDLGTQFLIFWSYVFGLFNRAARDIEKKKN